MPWKEKSMINERTEFALKALQPGVNFSALCAEYGISRKVGYKWKDRFLQKGSRGLHDQSRRPKNSPVELKEAVVCEIIRLKQAHPHWGPPKLHRLYEKAHGEAPSLSSFKRILDKAGLVKKRRRRNSSHTGRIHSGIRAEGPNDVWTVDFKGWWRTGDGLRCEPLTVRDEYSRYVLEVRAMATADTVAVRSCFVHLFEEHGLPSCIRSDNGAPFASTQAVLGLSRLSAWWVALGINLERGRPGKPQDNGAHERMHRDIRAEVQACAQEDLHTQQSAFDLWRHTFNQQRPHEALGMRTPAEVYQNSPRTYEGDPASIVYPTLLTRRVKSSGSITINSNQIFISSALAGWNVGLKYLERSRFEVYFAQLRLGELDLSSQSFLGAASGPKEIKSTNRTA
jgi:putative transposase